MEKKRRSTPTPTGSAPSGRGDITVTAEEKMKRKAEERLHIDQWCS